MFMWSWFPQLFVRKNHNFLPYCIQRCSVFVRLYAFCQLIMFMYIWTNFNPNMKQWWCDNHNNLRVAWPDFKILCWSASLAVRSGTPVMIWHTHASIVLLRGQINVNIYNVYYKRSNCRIPHNSHSPFVATATATNTAWEHHAWSALCTDCVSCGVFDNCAL